MHELRFLVSRSLILILTFGGIACSDGVARGDSNQSPAAEPAHSAVPAVEVLRIAGKTASEVEAVLGPPSSEEQIRNKGKSYPKYSYLEGDIEVVYVEGKADWITIFGEGKLPFDPVALSALGLPLTVPTFSNPSGVYRWEGVAGLREVSVFRGQGDRAHYAYVLTHTAP